MMTALLLSLLLPLSQVASNRLVVLNRPPLPSYRLTMGEVYKYPQEKPVKRPAKFTIEGRRP